uniref:Ski_Sno domain-containing protein n=1 Tax=Parastrongyloides trichosuri TaxID=131310 RepID=A0A0N4ZFC9_PARTI
MEYNFNFGNPIFRGDLIPLHTIPDDVNLQAQHFVYRNHRIAGFELNGEKYICIPQAFEIFLKNLVGGLHTVYTKLKRLNIHPIICNVEQVRELRNLGAIQPGVNRCKLMRIEDFDTLYEDCTCLEARPGRPPKRLLSMDQWISKREKFEEKDSSSSTNTTCNKNNNEGTESPTPITNNSNSGSNNNTNNSHNIMNAIFHHQFFFQQMLAASNANNSSRNKNNSNNETIDNNSNDETQIECNYRTQLWNEKYPEDNCKDTEENTESQQSASNQSQSKEEVNDDNKTFSSFLPDKKDDSNKSQENNSSTSFSNSSNKTTLMNSEPNSHSSIETCDSIKSNFTDRGSSGSSGGDYPNGNQGIHNNKNTNEGSLQFLIGKLSAIFEQAENAFKQHYEKMDLVIDSITKVSEIMSHQNYLMNKLEEERKRSNIYMKKYLSSCKKRKRQVEESNGGNNT